MSMTESSLKFGEEYGLFLSSEEGSGTMVKTYCRFLEVIEMKIMVAEDECLIRQLIVKKLAEIGEFTIKEVENGRQALAAAMEFQPTLLSRTLKCLNCPVWR